MIAENIKKYRKNKGISQDNLFKIAGVTYNTLVKIESAATSNPRVEILKQIPDGLNVRIDDLIKNKILWIT